MGPSDPQTTDPAAQLRARELQEPKELKDPQPLELPILAVPVTIEAGKRDRRKSRWVQNIMCMAAWRA